MRRHRRFFAFDWTSSVVFAALAAMLALGAAFADAPAGVEAGDDRFQFFASVEHSAYDASFVVRPAEEGEAVANAQFVFGVRDADHLFRLRIRDGEVSLHRRWGGEEAKLARAPAPEWQPGQPVRVQIRRRPLWVAVLFDDAEALRANDASLAEGAVGAWDGGQALRLGRWRVRPFEPFEFSDNFMRTDQDVDPWEHIRGAWRLHTIRDAETAHDERRGRESQAERSANFFSYEGRAEEAGGWALAASGDPAWSDFIASASVRSRGGWAGLAVALSSPGDFLLLRWRLDSLRERPAPVELAAFRNGQETVLARATAPGAAEQWYTMEIRTLGRRVEALLDGHTVFDLWRPDFGEAGGLPLAGRVGFYSGGTAGAIFDDLSVASNPAVAFDTADSLAAARLSGGWAQSPVSDGPQPGDVQSVRLVRSGGEDAAVLFDGARWGACSVRTRASFGADGATVALAMDDEEPLRAVFSRTAEGEGRASLVAGANGDERELAWAPFAIPESGEAELRLDRTERKAARVFADGRLLFRTPVPDGETAGSAILVSGPGEVALSGIQVSTHSRYDASRRVQQRLFATDAYMVGWATEAGAWARDAKQRNLRWHKSDFYGPFNIYLPPQAGTTLYIAATEEAPESGWVLALEEGGKDKTKMTLKRGGSVEVETVLATPPPAEGEAPRHLAIAREGRSLRLAFDDAEVATAIAEDPPTGTRVGGVFASDDHLKAVEVAQYDVKDYLFTEAPADWRTAGIWEVTTRFACDPRWSWYSATQWDGVATAWNKHLFKGDVTVEFYAGMRHVPERGASYPRPGEINVTVHGDGRNLDSGYSVVINGWDRFWSGRQSFILRNGHQVAFADRELVPSTRIRNPSHRVIPVEWDPGGRPIHGAWYYVKVRKVGDMVKVYFDDVLVMAYEDPKPLDMGRVAIWTMDNSIMIARVRIAYEHAEPAPLDIARLAPDEAPPDPPAQHAAPATVASHTHPGWACTFRDSLGGWQNDGGDQGAELALDEVDGQPAMRLTNMNAGGTFGARLDMGRLDAARVAELGFRYRIPPEVRVNLHMAINGVEHFVRLTGPGEHHEDTVLLGEIEGVEADGEWREASFDLAAAVARLYPEAKSLPVESLRIGHYHPGYGWAGIGANPDGAAYWLADFRVVSMGGTTVDFFVGLPDASSNGEGEIPAVLEIVHSVTKGEPAVPDGEPQTLEKSFAAGPTEEGLHYLNVKARKPGGEWLPPAHVPFLVASSAPEVASASPAEGGDWGGAPVALHFAGAWASRVHLGEATVKLNGRELNPVANRLGVGPDGKTLSVDVSAPGVALEDGEEAKFSLTLPPRFEGGEALELAWPLVYRRELDRTPPSAVRLADYPLYLAFDDPGDMAALSAPNHTALGRVTRNGRYALRILNRRLGGNIGASLFQGAVHAGKNPLLLFDYRIAPFVSADWAANFAGRTRLIPFTDRTPSGDRSSHAPTVVDDGRWHSAVVNLRQVAEELPGYVKPYELRRLQMMDTGYSANAPGAGFYLDNVRIAPTVGADGAALQWSAHDLGGIEGYALLWSQEPDGDPGEEVTHREDSGRFKELPEGLNYLHIRAIDRAGNPGPVSSYAFLVDNTPPEPVAPRGGRVAQGETVSLSFKEELSGIDLATLTLKLDEPSLSAVPAHSRFDHRRNVLEWDWIAQTPPAFGAVPDGTERVFRTGPVADFAGNKGPEAEWMMVIRHRDDKQPPPPPSLSVRGAKATLWATFESGNPFRPHAPQQTTMSVADRRRGDRCLHVAPTQNQPYGVILYQNNQGYDLREYPWLAFEHRFPANSRLALLVTLDGDTLGVNLTAAPRETKWRARIENRPEDNHWHAFSANLLDLAKQARAGEGNYRVTAIAIVRQINRPERDGFQLDSVAIFGETAGEATVRAASRDLTGIGAFGWEARAADGKLLAKGEAEAAEWPLEGLPDGLAHLLIRAQDGAGNWGEPSFYPICWKAPPPPAPPAEEAEEAQEAAEEVAEEAPDGEEKAEDGG